MENNLKDIKEEISPSWRKKLQRVKDLSIEEHFVLIMRDKIYRPVVVCITLLALLYWPFQLFIKSLQMGNSFFVSYLVGILSFIQVSIFAIGGSITVWIALRVFDSTIGNYYKRGKEIIKKLKGDKR
jgi:hypothetical protein